MSLGVFILVDGLVGGVLEKCGPVPDPDKVGNGLVQYGAECGRIGRGTPYGAGRSSAS